MSAARGFPVVGVGASAGGFEAFSQLLSCLPPDTGMAFVLVQHLDPKQESVLAQLLGRDTRMPVHQVAHGMAVHADNVYVIPPGKAMVLERGRFKLSPRATGHVIDQFFRSLAAERGSRAVGVVLSGTASDGVRGLEAIKAEGGLTLAQAEKTAQFPEMPRNAVAAGVVDRTFAPSGIARELAEIAGHPHLSRGEERNAVLGEGEGKPLARILRLVREASGIDFALYKRSTVARRVSRRMALHRFRALDEYRDFLEKRPGEAQALGQDMLIRVTSFFRDPASFAFLRRRLLPRLLKDRAPNEPLRIWVPGCSTGEEAYSIAMCAMDAMGGKADHSPVLLFATDVSDTALWKARQGLYSASAVESVPREYLRRFFVKVEGGYRVVKSARDACVFTRHNVAKDPPFPRLDLVSCRNLLIYLEPPLQQQVLSVFQYALRPGGCLFLGGSESLGPLAGLFAPVDKKHRVYLRKDGGRLRPPSLEPRRRPSEGRAGAAPARAPAEQPRDRGLFQAADRVLLSKYTPAAALVDEDFEILQFRGDTAHYLGPASGRASLNLLKMARQDLLFPLRDALQEARERRVPARRGGVRVERRGKAERVTIEVLPLRPPEGSGRCFLVVFEKEAEVAAAAPEPGGGAAEEREILRLREELAATRDHLQSIIEQREDSNGELRSANGEILSANEELQSANEELESTKEELQSVNEELTTVNDELRQRNTELGELNDDLNNLIAGVNMPVVILSGDLRIRRFTSFAEKALNLIPGDVGRPITDIKLSVHAPGLKEIVEQVIDTGAPREIDGQDSSGRWHQLRVRPYKTKDNKIDGALLIFVDVDLIKSASERHRRARDYAEAIFEAVRHPKLVLDEQFKLRRASRAFYEQFHVRREEMEGKTLAAVLSGQLPAHVWDALERLRREGTAFRDVELELTIPHVGRRTFLLDARRVPVEGEEAAGLLLALEDISERLQAQEARELRERAAMQKEFIANVGHELRTPISAILVAAETFLRAGGHLKSDEHLVEIIRQHGERLSRLVEDVLRLSALDAGRRKPAPQKIALSGFLEAFLDGLGLLADARGVRISSEVETGLSAWCDKAHLQTILENVCDNALRYNKRGGRVRLTARKIGDVAVVTVHDTGRGISAKELPHVFERFHRAKESRSGGGGMGLGLPIAKSLMEANGGRISLTSSKSEGTTISLALPLSTLPVRRR